MKPDKQRFPVTMTQKRVAAGQPVQLPPAGGIISLGSERMGTGQDHGSISFSYGGREGGVFG